MTVAEKFLKPIFRTVYKCRQKMSDTIPKIFDKTSNFIFEKSGDIAVIMLFFNAISLLSSHLAQIGGLKKSKRENKDFLITQEKQELFIDMGVSVVPPLLLHNFLKKKLESGKWQTASYLKKAEGPLARITGTELEEFGNISHIRPIRESLYKACAAICDRITNKHPDIPQGIAKRIKSINDFCKKRIYVGLPKPTMERIAARFEDLKNNPDFPISESTLQKANFRKNDAVKEFCNQNEGILILATIGYTILMSNILTPILKNKLSSWNYTKQLAKKGETRESIKRKKHFEYINNPLQENTNNLFVEFKNNTQIQNDLFKNISMSTPSVNKTFNNFSYKSSGLRI